MGEVIQEYIHIATDIRQSTLLPLTMSWRNRIYTFTNCAMQFHRYEGNTLLYLFYMVTPQATMQIQFNTNTLQWILMTIEPNI